MDDDTEFTSGRDDIYPGAAGDIVMTYDSQGNVIAVPGEAGGGNQNIPGGGGTSTYGTAGFGVGQVLGGDAARRQQEILTGSQYSANMPPPGYRPGFQPEYLYFGDPRYEDYAALLPGVYGAAPAAPAPRVDATTGLPIGTLENLTQADADKAMDLITSGQFDIDSLADQLELDRGSAFDAYNNYLLQTYGVGAYRPGTTLSDEDRKKYFDVANQFGFSPEQMSRIFGATIDEARSGLAQQYFGNIPVDQDYSVDEAQQVYDLYRSGRMDVAGISNYFGIPQGEVQSILDSIEGAGGAAAGIFGAAPTPTLDPKPDPKPDPTPGQVGEDVEPVSPLANIDVDGNYSDEEINRVYDMYVSGQVRPLDIAMHFNLSVSEVNEALANIAQSRMPVAGVGSTTVRPQDVRSTTRGTGAVDPMVGEETEGADITPISTALDLYKSGVELPPEQIRETLEYAQSNNISFAQLDRMFGAPAGSAQNAAAALGMAASAGGIAGMREGRRVMFDEMGKVITDESDMTQMFNELYAKDPTGPKDPTGEEIDEEIRMLESRIRRANIAKAKQFDELSSDPLNRIAGLVTSMTESAPSELVDRLDALKRARDRLNKAKGIKGMAEGKSVPAYDNPYVFPYGVTGMQESLEIVDKITDLENSLSITKDPEEKKKLEIELDMLVKFGGAVNGIPANDFRNFAEVQKARNRDMANKSKGIKGMAEGGEFPDLSGDGEVTQKDVLIGRGVIEKAEGGILSGITGLFEKEEEPKPQGGALLTETESYLEAQRILSDPDSSDRDRAFAKGTLETLKPEQQGGNMDMNAYSLMMQQVDKILGATRNMQEGGYIKRDELNSLIEMTRDAILGDAENADEIIQSFIAVFGNEAFQQLRETVLQSQVPDAQTEGMLEGQGGGMDDEINGMIGNQQPVAVSPGEYIIPADVVSSLGDGSSDAGADKLDKMLDDVRMEKTGTTVQPGKINDRVIPA